MTDNRTTELLPCPFCGGEATVERIGKSGYYYVACNTAYCCDFGKFDTEADAITAWNTRTHGTLTAEQAREAIYAHSIHADCADADWQAIADELNAELGSGTCHAIAIYNMNDEWCSDKCSACDYEWYEDEPNFCPNCGRKVVSA